MDLCEHYSSEGKTKTNIKNNSFLEEKSTYGLGGEEVQNLGRRNREARVQMPPVPLTSCVTLSHLLKLPSSRLLNGPPGSSTSQASKPMVRARVLPGAKWFCLLLGGIITNM